MRRTGFAQLAAAAVIALMTVGATPSFAEVTAGVRGSAFLPNDRDDGLSDFDTGWGVEAFVAYPLVPEFALELGVGYYRTEWTDPEDVIPESSTVKAIPVTLTAKGFVPAGERGRLYAGAGIGAYFAKADVEASWKEVGMDLAASDSSDDTAFGYHVVFGGELDLTETLALDAQVRWFRTEPNFTFFDDTATPTDVDVDVGGVLLSLGIAYRI